MYVHNLLIQLCLILCRPISPPHGSQGITAGNRRFRSRSPQSRGSRIRGRSPERYARSARSRSISPDRVRRRSFSRSRSRSPTYSRSRIQMSPDPPGYVPSAKAPRCRDYDEKGNIVIFLIPMRKLNQSLVFRSF